jgi:hypothetical protein
LVKSVKLLGIHYRRPKFSSEWFNRRLLRQFSALTNVQELAIDSLDIPSFMPMVQQYFGHFLPTLHSLALGDPIGSRRQILYFIGLFEHLENLTLIALILNSRERELADDLTLIPPFAPPLRGRLMIHSFAWVGFLEDMIRLFGGIRFRYMDLRGVDETPLLLGACAETLETVRLYPDNPHGEWLYPMNVRVPANDFADGLSFPNLDLSRNKALRALEVMAGSVVSRSGCCAPDRATSTFLVAILSTITSPTFSEIIVFYRGLEFHGLGFYLHNVSNPHIEIALGETEMEASWHRALFEVFREMHTVRGFRLMLCAEVLDRVGEHAVQILKRAVAVEKVARGFDYLPAEPMVVYSPQESTVL